MEEQVGQLWDRFVTRMASTGHEEAVVRLADVEKPVAMLFRALGGDGGLQLTTTEINSRSGRRSWLQRLAGLSSDAALAWRDHEYLRLPTQIDCFARTDLNRSLYLWLAALAAHTTKADGDWLWRSQQQTRDALEHFPGLVSRYRELVESHLEQRPEPGHLPAEEASLESAIRKALQDPGTVTQAPACRRAPYPVPLWLHPAPPNMEESGRSKRDDSAASRPSDKPVHEVEDVRKKAKLVDEPEKNRGLVTIRMENIFTWGEFINLDRGSEEEDDEQRSEDIARDIDQVAISRSSDRPAAGIKFDLDLPAEAEDDRVIKDGLRLPEWHWKRRCLLPDHCRVVEMISEGDNETQLPPHLQKTARLLRNRFQQLAPSRTWYNGRADGEEIDLESYQRFAADRASGVHAGTDRLYRALLKGHRDLSCLLLADLSLSTDAWINNDHRVIDMIRDSLYLFGESLNACDDSFAIHGFSTRRRDPIRIHRIKAFNEKFGGEIRSRIHAIKPGYYTRLGAGIRFAARELANWPASRRLLLILTDGKPNDLDQYEGRYGIEDTHVAIIEARQAGLLPFCVTIDKKANDYLPYLFGANNYVVVKKPEELPQRLALLYAMLTS